MAPHLGHNRAISNCDTNLPSLRLGSQYVALPRRENRIHFHLRGSTQSGTARQGNATYCEPSLSHSHSLNVSLITSRAQFHSCRRLRNIERERERESTHGPYIRTQCGHYLTKFSFPPSYVFPTVPYGIKMIQKPGSQYWCRHLCELCCFYHFCVAKFS